MSEIERQMLGAIDQTKKVTKKNDINKRKQRVTVDDEKWEEQSGYKRRRRRRNNYKAKLKLDPKESVELEEKTDDDDNEDEDEDEDEDTYVIEKVLDWKKGPDGALQVLIKWKDYPDEANTWEPFTSMNNALDSLQDFLKDKFFS